MKVEDRSSSKNSHSDFKQLELATGYIFDPTTSPVERIDVEINIEATKPMIYRDEVPF